MNESLFNRVEDMVAKREIAFVSGDATHVIYFSEWRCQDRFQNCTLYGKDMCNTTEYSAFAAEVCPRYCGRCKYHAH